MERYEIRQKYLDGNTDIFEYEEKKHLAFAVATQLSIDNPQNLVTIFDRLAHHGNIELWGFLNGKVISSDRRPA